MLCGDSDDEAKAEDQSEQEPAPPAYDHPLPHQTGNDTKRQSEQTQVHYIKPEETLLGLAMQYKLDVSSLAYTLRSSLADPCPCQSQQGPLLCKLNKLPISTLSTTPHLLHTLPFLLLPPDASSSSTTPLHTPLEERRRLVLRRFQVHTRCSEWALAKAYVQPGESVSDPFLVERSLTSLSRHSV